MRMVVLHVDYIRWEPKKRALRTASDAKSGEAENAIVAFVGIEEGDGNKVEKAIAELKHIADQIKVYKLVLYPFVHLTNTPAKPSVALDVLRSMAKKAAEVFDEVKVAPFGYYKAFEMKVKGHPLAEWGRII